jgi:hypothetical protein
MQEIREMTEKEGRYKNGHGWNCWKGCELNKGRLKTLKI